MAATAPAAARFGDSGSSIGTGTVTLGSGIRRRQQSADSNFASSQAEGITDEGGSELRRSSVDTSTAGPERRGSHHTERSAQPRPPMDLSITLARLMGSDDAESGGSDCSGGDDADSDPPSPTACTSPLRMLRAAEAGVGPPLAPVPEPVRAAHRAVPRKAGGPWAMGGYVDSSGNMVPETEDADGQYGVAALSEEAVDEILSSPRSPHQPKYQPEDRRHRGGAVSPSACPRAQSPMAPSGARFAAPQQASAAYPHPGLYADTTPPPQQQQRPASPPTASPLPQRRLSRASATSLGTQSARSGGGSEQSDTSKGRVVRRIVYVQHSPQAQLLPPFTPPECSAPLAQPFALQGAAPPLPVAAPIA
eukprot:TRINITY_DN1247_c0_g1_i1.p1 TRINITY_DN1247_c0_g1~~TRINITY_DN1247_c0_g1_i1.p1  ORF type:complete len:406 (+),score=90.72 TRINITY_DN1247_c0_g1_i1:129-1220(+)